MVPTNFILQWKYTSSKVFKEESGTKMTLYMPYTSFIGLLTEIILFSKKDYYYILCQHHLLLYEGELTLTEIILFL